MEITSSNLVRQLAYSTAEAVKDKLKLQNIEVKTYPFSFELVFDIKA